MKEVCSYYMFLKFLNLLPHCHQFPETPYLWAKSGGSKVAACGSKIENSMIIQSKKGPPAKFCVTK